LKAYSKRRFDPFCRWDRISIPYKKDTCIETTIGQLNFFKWALENKVVDYIEENYEMIEKDMNNRNSTSKRKETIDNSKTRKKREELSISATKSIKKEEVEIVVQFH
jgi:phage antirepressor YoqD-like protein